MLHIAVDRQRIGAFCRKWHIKELSLFGSVLRDDFRSDSDVDVLVDYEDNADWSLDAYLDAAEELKRMLGREVDLVEKPALRNPFRRHHILSNREIIYAS